MAIPIESSPLLCEPYGCGFDETGVCEFNRQLTVELGYMTAITDGYRTFFENHVREKHPDWTDPDIVACVQQALICELAEKIHRYKSPPLSHACQHPEYLKQTLAEAQALLNQLKQNG